jgi:hypothetical protein
MFREVPEMQATVRQIYCPNHRHNKLGLSRAPLSLAIFIKIIIISVIII